jgi:steroid 5-alpha reductase family enzyme
MNEKERRRLIAIPIILLIATGIAIAGSQGGVTVGNIPVFAVCVVVAFAIQWIAFIPAYRKQTEMFFDLTGSITYISVVLLALLLSPSVDERSWLLAGMVIIWAVRLGTFLFRRILAAGEDRRFREIKQSFPRFLLTWTLQGLWVTFSLAAGLAAITASLRVVPGIVATLGILVWLAGFSIEVIADWQKSKFREDPQNAGKFIQSGLWAWSRHPNYFGEIMLWIGVAIVALPVLRGWQWITMISPIFVFLLLTRISGVPMLEDRANEKWGGQADYEAYKANTPILIPLPPNKNPSES